MSTPKEFWIKDGEVHEMPHEDAIPYECHVIEYSAYESEKVRADRLEEENQKLKTALEKYEKIKAEYSETIAGVLSDLRNKP